MRPATRTAVAALAATAVTTSTWLVALPMSPANAAGKASTTATVTVTSTPYVGRSCVVSVSLRTGSGPLAGQRLLVQAKQQVNGSRWKTFSIVRTKSTSGVKASLKATYPVQLRAVYAGSGANASDVSKAAKCSPKTLRQGVKSPAVKQIQKKLKALKIRPSSTSGRFDANTLQAVYAFQKSRNFKRTGTVSATTWNRIMSTKKMNVPSWCKSSTTVCVSINRQVAYIKVGKTRYTFPVSSGGNYYYNDPQSGRSFARTPRGSFKVYYKKPGLSKGPLGTYYWMSFFTGGYGLHGSSSVPTYPASHGCVRVPRSIERWVYKNLPIGATVRVHD